MNICTFKGRIGRDAVTRHTQAGKAVTGFSLAVDIGWGDNKQTLWLDCSLWGDRGEKLAQHLVKGSQPTVSGEIGTREHDGKTYVTLNVREVSPEWQQDGSRGGEQRQQRQAPAGDFKDDSFEDLPF